MAPLKAGGPALSQFSGSMAQAIEQALNALLAFDGKDQLPSGDAEATRDRRRLFIAISTGVIEHLKANADAFTVVHDPADSVDHDLTIS